MNKKVSLSFFFLISVLGVIVTLSYFVVSFLSKETESISAQEVFLKNYAEDDFGAPKIISVKVSPKKVIPGEIMVITAEIHDKNGMKEVIANIGEIDVINLKLIEGTIYKGLWQGRWKAHSIISNKDYTTILIAKSKTGKNTAINIFWSDPSQTKNCSCSWSGCYCDITFSNFITSGYNLVSASIDVDARGDLNSASEYITVYTDGTYRGKCCNWNCSQCSSSYANCGEYDVTSYASDDYLVVRCDATSSVNYCSPHLDCRVILSWSEEPACLVNGTLCNQDSECCSNNCVADYDGVGSFCCDLGECSHNGSCYSNNSCQGTYICNSGTWINHCTDGVQNCDETGIDCGGSCGPCAQPCKSHNVYGWAWSENIGWISFSCEK